MLSTHYKYLAVPQEELFLDTAVQASEDLTIFGRDLFHSMTMTGGKRHATGGAAGGNYGNPVGNLLPGVC